MEKQRDRPGEVAESHRSAGTWAPASKPSLPPSPGKGELGRACVNVLQPRQASVLMRMQRGRPLQMELLPSLQESIHSPATNPAHTPHFRWAPRARSERSSFLPRLGAEFPGPYMPCPPKLPETGRENRKVNSQPFVFHVFPLQVEHFMKPLRLRASLPILPAFSDSIQYTAVTLRYNSCCSKINPKREKQVGE